MLYYGQCQCVLMNMRVRGAHQFEAAIDDTANVVQCRNSRIGGEECKEMLEERDRIFLLLAWSIYVS